MLHVVGKILASVRNRCNMSPVLFLPIIGDGSLDGIIFSQTVSSGRIMHLAQMALHFEMEINGFGWKINTKKSQFLLQQHRR